MKIKERVKVPQEILIEILKDLGYEEYRTDKINFVRKTPVGRIHVTLIKDRTTSLMIEIHHDIFGSAAHDHYTKQIDGTPKKAWNEIQGKIYDRILQKERQIHSSLLGYPLADH